MWVAVFVDQLDEEEVRLGVPLGSGHCEWNAEVSDRGCCDGCLVDMGALRRLICLVDLH